MDKSDVKQAVVQLDWANLDGDVTITPENQDRYNLKVRRVIEVCQAAAIADEFKLQLDILLQRLARWLGPRQDVRDAYLTTRDGRLLFVVVRTTPEYDEVFEDALSALDIEIANDADFQALRLDTLALPAVSRNSLASFINPSTALRYSGRRA